MLAIVCALDEGSLDLELEANSHYTAADFGIYELTVEVLLFTRLV